MLLSCVDFLQGAAVIFANQKKENYKVPCGPGVVRGEVYMGEDKSGLVAANQNEVVMPKSQGLPCCSGLCWTCLEQKTPLAPGVTSLDRGNGTFRQTAQCI